MSDQHKVTIVHESCAQNPFTDWDCEPMLASLSEKQVTDPGGLIDKALDAVSDWKLARHYKEILTELDDCPLMLEYSILDNIRAYGGSRAYWRRELIRELFGEARDSNRLEAAAACYRIAGIEALSTCSTGYCQGHYAHLLIVATPEWAKRVGAPRASHAEQLRNAAKLWGYWAWGDVWGYSIEDSSGEHVDSCFGFYGELGDRELIDSMVDHAGEEYRQAIAEAMDSPSYS